MQIHARIAAAAGLMVLVAAVGVTASPDLNWRARVALLKVRGELPEIGAIDLMKWMRPGSPVHLQGLAVTPNPSSAIRNLKLGDARYIAQGESQYRQSCSACHGSEATGGTGLDLLAFVGKSVDWEFFQTVKRGRKGTAMVAQPITDELIWSVHAYLADKSRRKALEHGAAPMQRPRVNVPFSRLVDARSHPEDWLMYSGDFSGHRHSDLDQINKQTVKDLHVAWAAQLRPATKPLSATPVVAGGLMFVTEAPDGVVALDASTGNVVWKFNRPVDPSELPLCCGAFNRGVAVLGDKVFVGTLDAYLVALDATTGKMLWQTQVADYRSGYSITTAPLALDGTILIGVAGGEFGIRGLVAAFSAADGKLVWQFDTVPEPGQPGSETWQGDSWKTGGASTWSVGVYDQKRDMVYWTVGNPWPPLDRRGREGDNLYSNSVVALDRKTGKLAWYFQFTPSDSHDWDATQQLIMTDVNVNGKKIPALLMASRNAFYYAIDRRDGKFIHASPFVKQTWSLSIDSKGRHQRAPDSLPSLKGSLIWPWIHGGTNWWPPSYDDERHLQFVPTVDGATQYFSVSKRAKAGEMAMGGTAQIPQNIPAVMAVKAIDPDTGNTKWVSRLDQGEVKQYSRIAGLVSTDGGIVVAGFEDRLSILDSDTGAELWMFRPGGQINAGAITYAINGRQHIAVIANSVLYAFALDP